MTPEDFVSYVRKNHPKIPVGIDEGLVIVGSFLDLANEDIESLPDNLTVHGFLSLSNTKISCRPKGLKVGGHIYLNNLLLHPFPKDLKIGYGQVGDYRVISNTERFMMEEQ